MSGNSRRGLKGFTLIELLIVIAVLGIISTILLPNLVDALNKSRQKRTMADMRTLGSALLAWHIDMNSAAAAGASRTTYDPGEFTNLTPTQLDQILVPRYIQQLLSIDAWKQPLSVGLSSCCDLDATPIRCNDGCNATFLLVSCGHDLSCQDEPYTFGPFIATDYGQDIVWTDGVFVRWPAKTGFNSP